MAYITVNDDKFDQNYTIESNIIIGEKRQGTVKPERIGEFILSIFNQKPEHVAQIDAVTGERITYRDMKENCISLALWMRKQGVQGGDVVAVCTHNRMDTYIPCIAAFLIGATLTTWYYEVHSMTAQRYVAHTKPKLIFCCESAVNVLKSTTEQEHVDTKIIAFGKHADVQSLEDVLDLQTAIEVSNFQVQPISDTSVIAMIYYTSGLTGYPKGVAHSYERFFKNSDCFNIIMKDCVCLFYSLTCWITGIFFMMKAIFNNATRIIHAEYDPEETCKLIDKYKVNWILVNTTMMAPLCRTNILKRHSLSSIQLVITGGEKSNVKIFDEFQKLLPRAFVNVCYGMTELGDCLMATTTIRRKNFESVGFVLPNVEIKIVDVESNKSLGPNQTGEICVRTASLMVGYFKDPATTNQYMDKEGWLHSRDIGYYHASGEIFIIGKMKMFIKYRGEKFSPHEVEEVLLKHPGVMEAAVVAVPHDEDYERAVAFVKKVPGSEVTEEKMIELSAILGKYKKITGGVKFLDKLPHTASGKVDRKTLAEMAANNAVKL